MHSLTTHVVRPLHARVTIAQLAVIVRHLRFWEDALCAALVVGSAIFCAQQIASAVNTLGMQASLASPALHTQSVMTTSDNNPAVAEDISFAPAVTQPAPPSGPTSQELQTALDEWAAQHPGLNLSASFQEIGGSGRQAAHNGDARMETASVYKLYLATYALKQIESGALDPNKIVVNGRSVAQCIEAMIVNSDNPCGEQVGYLLGWSKLHAYTTSVGMTNSKLNISPLQVTASDSVRFLSKLESGSLLSRENTDYILGLMSRQVQRRGIPAGTAGATVYDKPGWTGAIWNDVAIVRDDQGTSYLLAIYSNSRSPQPVSDLANRLATLLATRE